MQRALFAMTDGKVVQVAIGARPTGPAHGVDILSWRSGEFSGAMAAIFITGSAAATISGPSGSTTGVELWGYRIGKWWLITELRDGRDITIDASGDGYAQQANVIGIFERLAVAGDVSAGAGTAKLAPIDSWS